jgi:hypothetical protein
MKQQLLKTFHIYSDESRHKNERFLLLSGLWVEEGNIRKVLDDIQSLRKKHGYVDSYGNHVDFVGEFKWTKVSPRYLHVYKEAVDLLFGWIEADLARFNTMLIDTRNPNVVAYSNINREGYFKFLYQLYFHNSKIPGIYKIYPDRITNPMQSNVSFEVLGKCLNASLKNKFVKLLNPAYVPPDEKFLLSIIPVDSKSSQLIQFVDVIMGGIGFLQNELDHRENASKAKVELMKYIFDKLILSRAIQVSGKSYYVARSTKFNIWLFRPKEKGTDCSVP